MKKGWRNRLRHTACLNFNPKWVGNDNVGRGIRSFYAGKVECLSLPAIGRDRIELSYRSLFLTSCVVCLRTVVWDKQLKYVA